MHVWIFSFLFYIIIIIYIEGGNYPYKLRIKLVINFI